MSEKNLDMNGRWRSVTVAFRVSPEEAELIDALVSASGLTKQSCITERLLQREVVVVPHVRTYKGLRNSMEKVYRELRRIRDCSDMSPELVALTEVLANEFIDLRGETSLADVEQEDAVVRGLERA